VTLGIVGSAVAFAGEAFGLAFAVWLGAMLVAWVVGGRALPGAALGYAEQLRVAVDAERGKVLGLLGLAVPDPLEQGQEEALWRRVGQWWEYAWAPGPYTLATGTPAKSAEEGADA